jgi:hypothetical protein
MDVHNWLTDVPLLLALLVGALTLVLIRLFRPDSSTTNTITTTTTTTTTTTKPTSTTNTTSIPTSTASADSRARFSRRLQSVLGAPTDALLSKSTSSSLRRSSSDLDLAVSQLGSDLRDSQLDSPASSTSRLDAYAYFEHDNSSNNNNNNSTDSNNAADLISGVDGGYGYVDDNTDSSGYVDSIGVPQPAPANGYEAIDRAAPSVVDSASSSGYCEPKFSDKSSVSRPHTYSIDPYDDDDVDDDDDADRDDKRPAVFLHQHSFGGTPASIPITTFQPTPAPPSQPPTTTTTWSSSVPSSGGGGAAVAAPASFHRGGTLFQGDWNERFQKIWDVISNFHTNTPQSERMSQNLQLLHLAQDFLYSCVTYGRIILSELALPDAQKTIRPSDVGGVAGGTKYIAQRIMFKLAIDKDGFFGGSNDYAAAKVAGHELKGLQAYMNAGVKELHYPLMALVDYRGFRLIAMSILPIDRGTIVYGSADAGTHVHSSNERVNRRMLSAARALNLKPHVVGRFAHGAKMLASAGDLEGHVGRPDGKFYLCDFSRAMPPETPVRGVPLGHLYRLLRPEFVRRHPTPLCSDGFSAFVRLHNPTVHCRELRDATNVLLNHVIPRFAAKIVELVKRHKQQSGGVLSAFSVTNAVHADGINVRHIGLLRSHVDDTDTRAVLLVEMCARLVKNDLKFRLRERMKQTQVPLEQPYRRDVVEYLNTVLASNEASRDFWNLELRRKLEGKFGAASLNADEQRGELKWYVTHFRDWRNDGLLLLLDRVVELTGIKLRLAELNGAPNAWLSRGDEPLDETDLIEFGVRVKFGSLVERAEAMFYKSKALLTQNSDLPKAVRFFRLALERFVDALHTDPDNADPALPGGRDAPQAVRAQRQGRARPRVRDVRRQRPAHHAGQGALRARHRLAAVGRQLVLPVCHVPRAPWRLVARRRRGVLSALARGRAQLARLAAGVRRIPLGAPRRHSRRRPCHGALRSDSAAIAGIAGVAEAAGGRRRPGREAAAAAAGGIATIVEFECEWVVVDFFFLISAKLK